MTAPWTNAVWLAFASLHGPAAGSVAVSWYGVASPCAVSGLAGTMSVQFGFGVAADESATAPAATHRPAPMAATAMIRTLTTAATRSSGGMPNGIRMMYACPAYARRRARCLLRTLLR